MADSFSPISLTDLLIRLLADHVPKEVAYQEALHQHTKDSKFCGDELDGDPPIWERTAWDTAVRWLARKSAYFHSLTPDECFDYPIKVYEQQLRSYLADVKQGGPTQSNPAAAELLEYEKHGMAAELLKVLEADLPVAASQKTTLPECGNVGDDPRPRLSVDLKRGQATLDGNTYDVTSNQTLRWLKVLADHPGDWIAGSDLQTYDTELDGVRTDKLRPHLPDEIASLIESSTGKGSRFNPGATAVARP